MKKIQTDYVETQWVPMSHVGPGRTITFRGEKYLVIPSTMTIGKDTVNVVNLATGQLAYCDIDYAVKITA